MITAQRATTRISGRLLGLLGSTALALTAAPGAAQVNDAIVLNIMRECARIDDPTARLACYDNNIRSAGANPRSIPGEMARPSGGGSVMQPRAGGFGADDLRSRAQPGVARGGASQISTRVSGVRERQPNTWLVELENGNQWLMSESVGGFRPPSRGDTIEIERGALGGYLMVVNGQQGVRVTRVK